MARKEQRWQAIVTCSALIDEVLACWCNYQMVRPCPRCECLLALSKAAFV